MQRLLAFNRRHMHREPTREETKVFEADKATVATINELIEREYASRPLMRTAIKEQFESILQQEQQATCRSQPRRR